MLWRNRLEVARAVWGLHPRQLEGDPYDDLMMADYVALALLCEEERG